MTGTRFPHAFEHPASGHSERAASLVAVRWSTGADPAAKQALVDRAGLTAATIGTDDRRPAVVVNRTDGLWWLRAAGGGTVEENVLATLDASDLVEWVSPAYSAAARAGAGPAVEAVADAPAAGALFAVNPTRIWVRGPELERAGGPAAVGATTAPGRASRIPGYTVVPVSGRAAFTAATRIGTAAPGDGAVKLETVPFVSPTTAGRAPAEISPDDPSFGIQWSLQRTEVPAAWDLTQGHPDVVIAVIDEGVELGHPDLDLYPQSWNASTDTPDGSPTGNHGTACAGIAAARTNNALGVAGAAGGCRVMAIATATWADVDIAEGLYFAADNGARVVSMSFGVYPEWNFWDFDLVRDALQYCYDKGLLLVAAAGNEDGPVSRFPGSDSRTLCVGGSNRSDERKRGGDASAEPWWGASYGPDLDVVAPCLEIATTDRLGGDGYDPGDYYDRFNGTSSATPLVAGIAALVFSLRPDLDNVRVRHLLESTCDKVSPAMYGYVNVATKPSGTWNAETGYGRVNALRALIAAGMVAEPARRSTDGAEQLGAEQLGAGTRG
jgi:thermitase